MDLHYIPSTRPPPTVFPVTLFALCVRESNTQHQTSTNNPNFSASLSASLVFKTTVRCFAVSVLEEKNNQDTLYGFHFTTCFHLVCLKANSLNRPDGTMRSVFFFCLSLFTLLGSGGYNICCSRYHIPGMFPTLVFLAEKHQHFSYLQAIGCLQQQCRTLCPIDPQHPKSPPRLSGVLGQTLGYSLALLPTTLTQRSKPKAALAAAGTCGEVSERFAFFFFFFPAEIPRPFSPGSALGGEAAAPAPFRGAWAGLAPPRTPRS